MKQLKTDSSMEKDKQFSVGYTDPITKVKQIISEIENDDLTLEEVTDKIKEASVLLKNSRAKLKEADDKIQELLNDVDQ